MTCKLERNQYRYIKHKLNISWLILKEQSLLCYRPSPSLNCVLMLKLLKLHKMFSQDVLIPDTSLGDMVTVQLYNASVIVTHSCSIHLVIWYYIWYAFEQFCPGVSDLSKLVACFDILPGSRYFDKRNFYCKRTRLLMATIVDIIIKLSRCTSTFLTVSSQWIFNTSKFPFKVFHSLCTDSTTSSFFSILQILIVIGPI